MTLEAQAATIAALEDPVAANDSNGRRRRWRPRIGIGSLLWLMLIVGILLAWRIDRQRLITKYEAGNVLHAQWGPVEATGVPNTPTAGDIPTAWASQTPDGQKEWLELEYETAVRPRVVEVHETYNPGALYQIGLFDQFGREHIVWRGIDPTQPPAAKGVSRIKITPKFATKRIKIYLDSPKVTGWNEIDAVGLIDAQGKTHWATRAKASSTFASVSGNYYSGFTSFGGSRIIIQPEPEVQLEIEAR